MSDSTPTLPVIKLRDLFEANAKRKAEERTFDYLGRHNVHLLFNTREEENKMPREKEVQMDKLTATEALFGFCGWLTTRQERTIMSSSDDSAPIVRLITRFIEANALAEPGEGWQNNLIHPADEYSDQLQKEYPMCSREKVSINAEEAQSIVAYLMRTGVLDEETVELALREEPTEEMKQVCEILHGIVCKGDHDALGERYCSYLNEDAWNEPDHKKWIRKVEDCMTRFYHKPGQEVHPQDLLPIIQRALSLSNNIQAAGLQDPAAYKMLLYIRGWEE